MMSAAQYKYIATTEQWYPTSNGMVKVSLLELSNRLWRVCVWGGDDFGLEKDFPHTERQAAKKLFHKINDYTTQAWMREQGMHNA